MRAQQIVDALSYYVKGIAGLVSAAGVATTAVVDAPTWLLITIAVAGAVAVYAFPNRQPLDGEHRAGS